MESEAESVMTKRSPASSRFPRVCVFCGSSSGKKESYRLAAIQLGHELVSTPFTNYIINSIITGPVGWFLRVALFLNLCQVQRNIDLVYGGGRSSNNLGSSTSREPSTLEPSPTEDPAHIPSDPPLADAPLPTRRTNHV
ncbi:hypothetical protein ZIOFF_022944 [Zingiber officinale]|uniref:Uncharacterized protein n=1 Tax=Zingiber officinale TaxID=94328 RepID=A0A8J5HAF8_ZINOF|nr:hypothetical protein ZIOFF_022944 [Zingiber officinale]